MKSERVLNVSVDSSESSQDGNGGPPKSKRLSGGRASRGDIRSDPQLQQIPPTPWPTFLETADNNQIRQRLVAELTQIEVKHKKLLEEYCCLALFDPERSLNTFDVDRIYNALGEANPECSKNVLLLILSPGGSVESAYQISKVCKAYSKDRFVAVVPRQAKSAATLLAIGADQIHMGTLGQLGPIDPQLGHLPALGVSQALSVVASITEKYPGSAEMFARYLERVLTVTQIGYCERIAESAVQYAERLLSTKSVLPHTAAEIANKLVYEYKDHGFVIDADEARTLLGAEWVKLDTPECRFADEVYKLFDDANLYLKILQEKRLLLVGGLPNDVLIFNEQTR